MKPFKQMKNIDYKKLFNSASLILVVGIVVIIYANRIDCRKIVPGAIAKGSVHVPFPGKRNAIYFIKEINTGCRSCAKYDILKKQPEVMVTFFVDTGYTENDIVNFREAFHIEPGHAVKVIDRGWKEVLEKCSSKENREKNTLILVDEKNQLTRMWRF